MQLRRSLLIGALAAAVLAGLSLFPLGPFEVFELKTLDLRFRLRERWRTEPLERFVRPVLLDDQSLAAYAHWPLPYDAYADAVAHLREAGVRVLGVDVLLAPADTTRPFEERSYRRLMAELDATRGTVLAVAPPAETSPPVGGQALRVGPVPEASVYPWACDRAAGEGEIALTTRELPGLDLARSVDRLGHAELVRDEDGVVRRVPLLLHDGEACYPSFVLQVVCAYEGVLPHEVKVVPGLVELWHDGHLLHRIKVDHDGNMLINYRNRSHDPEQPLSLADIAGSETAVAQAGVGGRVVLIGSTARAFGDFHSTPLAPQVADVEVLGEAVETILSGDFLGPVRRGSQFIITWVFLFAGALFMLRLPPWRGVFLGLGLMALYVVFEKICFIWGGLWLDFIGPMAAMQAAVIAFPLWNYRTRSQGLLDEMAELRNFDDLILSTMTSGLLVADESGRVVKANARACQLLGCDEQPLEGQTLKDLFCSSQRALAAIESAMLPLDPPARGPACSLPVHVPAFVPDRAHDGDRLLDLSISSLEAVPRWPRRPSRHFLLTFADVTEHLRVMQEDERRARLVAIGEIAAKLGHEIRNSLGGLRLYVENVREDINPKSQAVGTIDCMVEEIESLYRKIDELREYARDPKLELSECDLKELVEEALAYSKQRLREKNIQVFVETPPHMGNVRVDRREMRAAFQNLILNAAEAAPEGGSLRILLERSAGTNGVPAGSRVVHFEDDGPGIPEEVGDQIFSLFFTTKSEAGTGLGLPIVKKIIEGHGGRLGYTSRPGCTRFTVTLPPSRHGEGNG